MPDRNGLDGPPEPWNPMVQQKAFRKLMSAFSYPGRIENLCGEPTPGDGPITAATLWVLATLLDGEVSLADENNLLVSELAWERLAVPRESPESAAFILAPGNCAPKFQPRLGTLESPEAGSTIIVRVGALIQDLEQATLDLRQWLTLRLKGPGIQGTRVLAVAGLDPGWINARTEWVSGFPLGVDLIFVDDARVVALPRTTRIEL